MFDVPTLSALDPERFYPFAQLRNQRFLNEIKPPHCIVLHADPTLARSVRGVFGMVAADVRRRILARKILPPRYLGGYASCVHS